ncbi:hypothetical protein CI102_262 [Trichoderma harzianum]|nr:hypothetical protein CI102_262 [Trichoderma harzianum]
MRDMATPPLKRVKSRKVLPILLLSQKPDSGSINLYPKSRLMSATVVMAPGRPAPHLVSLPSVFLAGTTSDTGEADWRQTLTEALSGLSITIYNPYRSDWDATWREDISDNRWVEQVHWELEMQDKADIVVVFFHGVSLAPISMLELGMCIRFGKAIICAMPDYLKRGNVEAVCRRYGATFVSSEQDLKDAVTERLNTIIAARLG